MESVPGKATSITSIAACAFVAVVIVSLLQYLNRNRVSQLPLPPGPKALLVIGNLLDLPPHGAREWEHWLKHRDLYGPISSVTVFGTHMILLNDAEVALELLEKRSNIHSSRPSLTFAGELCEYTHILGMLSYNARMRSVRKHLHAVMGTKSNMKSMVPVQQLEVHRFLLRVLKNPRDLSRNIRLEAGAIILKTTYNYSIKSEGSDPLVEAAERVVDEFTQAVMPGAWLVDFLPALKYLPDWFPGTSFKRTAREFNAHVTELRDWPYRFVKHEMNQPSYQLSFLSKLCERAGHNATEEDETAIKTAALSLFVGGADSTVSTLETFFLAMTLHPQVQRKAHAEIDQVIGTKRLPTLDDRSNLPYVDAIAQECLRWHPIAPMGLAHTSSSDDTYGGYCIPKDAILMPNVWWFTHDPKIYHDPASFCPERFVGDNPEPDAQNVIFGFGRRVCPGRLLADSSVFLTIARSLAVFDIASGLDEKQAGTSRQPEFTSGILSRPCDFEAVITARSSKHEALIREVEGKDPLDESSAEVLLSLK